MLKVQSNSVETINQPDDINSELTRVTINWTILFIVILIIGILIYYFKFRKTSKDK